MSNVNANTIRAANGSLGTDIRIKNTSVYESDGGTSVTQNLVQGVAKVWNNVKQTGTQSIQDSFNVGSIVDTAVGFTTTNFSNPMNNTGYSITACSEYNTMQGINTGVSAAGAHGFVNLNSGGSYEDRDDSCLQIMGDLA